MSGSLTPADREWGMEHALGHFEYDWIRTIARAEASDDDAIMTVRCSEDESQQWIREMAAIDGSDPRATWAARQLSALRG